MVVDSPQRVPFILFDKNMLIASFPNVICYHKKVPNNGQVVARRMRVVNQNQPWLAQKLKKYWQS